MPFAIRRSLLLGGVAFSFAAAADGLTAILGGQIDGYFTTISTPRSKIGKCYENIQGWVKRGTAVKNTLNYNARNP